MKKWLIGISLGFCSIALSQANWVKRSDYYFYQDKIIHSIIGSLNASVGAEVLSGVFVRADFNKTGQRISYSYTCQKINYLGNNSNSIFLQLKTATNYVKKDEAFFKTINKFEKNPNQTPLALQLAYLCFLPEKNYELTQIQLPTVNPVMKLDIIRFSKSVVQFKLNKQTNDLKFELK